MDNPWTTAASEPVIGRVRGSGRPFAALVRV